MLPNKKLSVTEHSGYRAPHHAAPSLFLHSLLPNNTPPPASLQNQLILARENLHNIISMKIQNRTHQVHRILKQQWGIMLSVFSILIRLIFQYNACGLFCMFLLIIVLRVNIWQQLHRYSMSPILLLSGELEMTILTRLCTLAEFLKCKNYGENVIIFKPSTFTIMSSILSKKKKAKQKHI